MADSHISSKIYSNLGIVKQVSSGSHLSVLTSKVEFAPSSNGCSGTVTNEGSFLQNKYTQLGTGSYSNHINNNNNIKEAPLNGQIKHLQGDKQKYVRVHQQQQKQQQNFKEDSNRNLVTEGWPPEPRNCISDPRLVCLDWVQPGLRIGAGLTNLGNTCFMNTVIQCLTYCPPLATYLLQDPERHCTTCKITSFCMMCELQKHIKRALYKHGVAIRPTYMYQKLKSIAKHFQPGRQEDAHEFLRYVIDNLWKSALSTHEGYAKLDPASKETTAINHIFGGYSRSQVVCLRCHGCSNTYDHFMDIILDIKGVSSLEAALEKFVEPEMLEDDNAYKCPKCNLKVRAQKKFTVYKAPNVATFQFKRFDYHRFNGGKITKHINYPEKLNLRSYMAEKTAESVWYRLNSVLVHAGHTCNSGHYYCYVRSPNNQWYRMDDTMVHEVGINQVLHQQAYVLFYVRFSSQKNLVKKPAVPINSTQLHPEKNGTTGHVGNMNRTLNNSPRPLYLNSHSCSGSRPDPPLTNGTLAPPTSKIGSVQLSTISKLAGRDRIIFSLNKNSSSPLAKVKGRVPDDSIALPQVHSNLQTNKQKTLVPYTGDSSASTSDSSSEPERKQPKLSNSGPGANPSHSLAPKLECNGNAVKEEPKLEGNGKKVLVSGFERPSDGTISRMKSTNNWNICDANLQSPSIASNSSNNSMNSTTMDWNVTEQEGPIQRHNNRNYNGWAITAASSTTTVSMKAETDSLPATFSEPQMQKTTSPREASSSKTKVLNVKKETKDQVEEEEEEDTEAEESRLLPFRATPQGGGGESKLCPRDDSQWDDNNQWVQQQSSQNTVSFRPANGRYFSACNHQQQQQQQQQQQTTTSNHTTTSAAAATNSPASTDGKRKWPDVAGGHEKGNRSVSKRHKDWHHYHRSSSSSSETSSNGSTPKADRALKKRQSTPKSRQSSKEERRKTKQSHHHRLSSHTRSSSSSSSSSTSSSTSSSSEEWEERTKDTIEKERKQRLHSGAVTKRHWDDKSQTVSAGCTGGPHTDVLNKLISNGSRGYGTTVNSWDGGKSSLDNAGGSSNHRKRYSDQYNEELDRGKERKDRRRNSHPNSFVSYGNPFQNTYDRRRSWNMNGHHGSWNRFNPNYHKQHHYNNNYNNSSIDYHHHNKKHQKGSFHNRYSNFSGRDSYNHQW